jgi:glutathione S-transferase
MQKLTLIIGNKAYSSWSLRPWLALRHAGAKFEEIRVPLYTPGYKAQLLALSPAGKVPALRHGDVLIWESLAICEYVAELFPQAKLWPTDSAARAQARSLCTEMHAGFTAIRSAMPFNCRAKDRQVASSGELEQEITRVQTIWRECRAAHQGRAGPWLFGHFTVADAMYAPIALRFVTYGVQLDAVSVDYVDAIYRDRAVEEWIKAARHESETIPSSEVGQ